MVAALRLQTQSIRMIDDLNIPIEYVEELTLKDELVTVDCQYGAGNVKNLMQKYINHRSPSARK